MFWVAHVGVGQPACSRVAVQHAGPNGYDSLGMGVAFQQIEWIELEGSIEQEFDVVQQQQVARGMLIGQLTQDRRGLQVALSLRDAPETTAQLSPDIQRRHTLALGEGVQQCSLALVRRADEQDELALQRPDFIDQTFQLFDHPRLLPDGTRSDAKA